MLVLVVARKHPLASKRRLAWTDLATDDAEVIDPRVWRKAA